MLKAESQPFHIKLFSLKNKFSLMLFTYAIDKEDAKKQGYRWIHQHGFSMVVTKIYSQAGYEAKYPKAKSETQAFFCNLLGWTVKKEECFNCRKNRLVPKCSKLA